MMHFRPWNAAIVRLMVATERQRGNLVFAVLAFVGLLIIAAGLHGGEAHAAATAADWATNPTQAAAATGAAIQAAGEAAGWSWGQIAAGAGAVALFLARFVPGVGGTIANVAWQAFADRRARQADQAASAATIAVRLVHDLAPGAVQTAIDKLPPDQAAAVRSLIEKA
jgi:hypothetical protein